MLFSYGYARQIINNRKNAAALLAISMTTRISRYGAECIAQWGRSRATLDATGRHHRQLFAPYRPSRRLFEASVEKARNRPSTQLIEATSCVERSNATIKAKELT